MINGNLKSRALRTIHPENENRLSIKDQKLKYKSNTNEKLLTLKQVRLIPQKQIFNEAKLKYNENNTEFSQVSPFSLEAGDEENNIKTNYKEEKEKEKEKLNSEFMNFQSLIKGIQI